MGRKKIQITRIADERNRQITFSKRKAGLLKKAYELSILCDVEIAVIMITNHNKLYQYASSNMNSILIRYTEFKDPDESKTNADILDDLNRRDKSGNESGEEDTDSQQLPLSPSTHSHYPRMDEEFEQVLRNDIPHHGAGLGTDIDVSHNPAPIISLTAPSNQIPLAMPVSVPVTSSSHKKASHLGSAGSSISSPNTPASLRSPFSDASMPPPTTTPTRLQTIRSHALKLHLPGKAGNRNYVPLRTSTDSDDRDNVSGSPSRPQLTVVIPGQKGFVPTSVESPPLVLNMDDPVSSPPPLQAVAKTVAPPTKTMASNPAVAMSHSGSLTTPIMSLTTPSLISSLPPGEGPLGGGGEMGSASALVAFPVSIQPGSNTTPGSNIIIQAQNMGQPFLLTPTPNQGGSTSLVTPPILSGNSPSTLRDLEQLKLQYDRIYQQISQTLQHHQLQVQDVPTEEESTTSNGAKPYKRGQDNDETKAEDDGPPTSKRPNIQ